MIDPSDPNVFTSTMSMEDAVRWLMGDTNDLSDSANGAIDEAASWTRENGPAYIIIKIERAL
jgi:hypothetical protein